MCLGETHQLHDKNLFDGLNLKTRPISQDELNAAAAARGALIQAFENGEKCNPQDGKGNLLLTSDAVIKAMQENNG